MIQEEIAKPLGLQHTYMPDGPRYKDEVIHGYTTEGGKLKDTTGMRFADVINYDLAHTPGGMVSTLADLKIWVNSLAAGQLLSERMHKEQLRTIPNPASKDVGYGLGVSTYKGWLGHSGGVGWLYVQRVHQPESGCGYYPLFQQVGPSKRKTKRGRPQGAGRVIKGDDADHLPGYPVGSNLLLLSLSL